MILDELATRLAHTMPGYDLICQYQAGIPIYRARLIANVISKHEIPTIPQFALHLIRLGVATEAELAEALGLETVFIHNALGYLDLNQLIRYSPGPTSPGSLRFSLTDRGTRALREAILEMHVEHFAIHIDGFTGAVVAATNREFANASDLRKEGIWLLQAVPGKRPTPSSLNSNLSDLRSVYRTHQNSTQMGLPSILGARARPLESTDELLEILEVERTQLFFRVLNVLAFREKEGKHLSFRVFDGYEPVEEYGAILTRRERDGGRVIPDGLLQPVADYPSPSSIVEELRPVIDEARQLDESLRSARAERENLQASSSGTSSEESPDATAVTEKSQKILDLQSKIARLEAQLESAATRVVHSGEHRQILKEAITSAQRSIVIISPWIRSDATDKEIISLIEAAVKRGVWVLIGYGMPLRKGESENDFIDESIRSDFDRIRRGPNGARLIVESLGNTHEKLLVCDEQFCVVTSFNWLSYRGDKGFRREMGTYSREPSVVQAVYEVIDQFESVPAEFLGDQGNSIG